MKIAFYGTKPYDKIWFEPMGKDYGFDIHFIELPCNEDTIFLANGYDAICIFVNDYVNAAMIDKLYDMKVKAILLRSAGFNNVDIKAAENKLVILRVPSYSPEAVAEFAMALLLTVNRFTHRAYNRTREFNMSLNGLMGTDLNQKVAGIIGTGKIGQAMIRICKGFGMQILAYDPYPNKELDVKYVSIDELVKKADVISLHCPLTPETEHIINKDTITLMKQGVYLINTSRGRLIDTEAVIDGLREGKFGGVGLDVYEEEEGLFFEDRSNDIITDDNLARLMTFPNVLVTSHMGFFTQEAMQAIAIETLENAYALENGLPLVNQVGTDGAH
ncbi:MAG: 2-hydroxyacid dehydrogenase [Lachnospiraceae bacterium]|nr:2-hydroxyacid dehydrogenase [Lachnospiraceae bacterium]